MASPDVQLGIVLQEKRPVAGVDRLIGPDSDSARVALALLHFSVGGHFLFSSGLFVASLFVSFLFAFSAADLGPGVGPALPRGVMW